MAIDNALAQEGADILDALVDHMSKYVVFANDAQADVLAGWVMHTYAINAAHATPYIYVSSDMMRSGKTRLLEVLEQLAHAAIRTVGITPAALFNIMNEDDITLMIDEIDTVYGPGKKNEDLRQVLNGGYRRGSHIVRYSRGKGILKFDIFGPKVLAGIDTGVPGTVKDRCIEIKMERREGQPVEPFVPRKTIGYVQGLHARIRNWVDAVMDDLKKAEPDSIIGLDDRAMEISEPIAAIFDLCGNDWNLRGRDALTELLYNRETAEETVILLEDIREAFADEEKITTVDLLHFLRESGRKGYTSRQLAKECRGWFGVEPTTLNMGGDKRAKGYRLMDFAEPFARYLKD
jgi:hypothetical protein